MNKYAIINKDSFPIAKIIFTGIDANDQNFESYLNEVKNIYEQGKQVALIFDATLAVFPALKYQIIQAKWLKENEQLMKANCEGTAYIIPKLVIRNVLKAIFKIQKQPVPYLICKTNMEAEIWTKNQLSNK